MIARDDWLRPKEIRNPTPPAPMNFAVRQVADERDLRMARSLEDRQSLFDRMKRHAAHKLADHIFEHCKFFEVPDLMSRNLLLQLELTISDRGAYENYLPVARQQGRAEGRAQAIKQMVESLPYGLADATTEFYE